MPEHPGKKAASSDPLHGVVITSGYILLAPDVLATVRSMVQQLEEQQRIMGALELLLQEFLREKTGVNVKDESWNLDTLHGILTPNSQSVTSEALAHT